MVVIGGNLGYVCLCYGKLIITPQGGGRSTVLESSHHDQSVYIPLGKKGDIQPAKMMGHTDDELRQLEALVR